MKRPAQLSMILYFGVFLSSCISFSNEENDENYKGTVEKNTYINKYFSFKFDIPEGWDVLSREELEAFDERISSKINRNKDSKYKVTENTLLYFFAMIKNNYDNSETGDNEIQLLINGEHLKGLPISESKKYINSKRHVIKMKNPNISVGKMLLKRLDGERLYGFKMERPKSATTYQFTEFYTLIRMGYAIQFSISYNDEKFNEEMHQLLDTHLSLSL